MSEARMNARVFPVLAALAFLSGTVMTFVKGRGMGAALFASSAVMFAVSWFFQWQAGKEED
ncbi:hypothetical protein GCM10010357_62280 [Streptomyces luteireticuli]|uniref:Uncharacterized protein n=1 Tax=Streptomyces luteireticuli TaxID=173858 RepID=A0ABP3IXR7_9ACTN